MPRKRHTVYPLRARQQRLRRLQHMVKNLPGPVAAQLIAMIAAQQVAEHAANPGMPDLRLPWLRVLQFLSQTMLEHED